jgi:hypothetical protein
MNHFQLQGLIDISEQGGSLIPLYRKETVKKDPVSGRSGSSAPLLIQLEGPITKGHWPLLAYLQCMVSLLLPILH